MSMGVKEQAIEFAKVAVAADEAGDLDRAFHNYRNAVEYFMVHLKYEKNVQLKQIITDKVTEYLGRAEQIANLNGAGRGGGSDTLTGRGSFGGAGGGGGSGGGGSRDGGARDEEELDPELAKLRASLGGSVMTETPNVHWSDVAGLEGAKAALKEAVIIPVQFPHFFVGKRKPWKGVLLYGPPGTGKSYLAKAVATEANATFISVTAANLVSKWMGESEKLVNQLFALARASAPCIIFLDEIDSLASSRDGSESEAARRIKTEFLVQMDGVGPPNHGKRMGDDPLGEGSDVGQVSDLVLVLAATNLPYALDHAIRRRFDKRIYIPLPDNAARAHMFKVHLGDTPHSLTKEDFEELGKRTERFSGSDIAVAVKDALMEPVRFLQEATHFKWVQDAPSGSNILHPCSPADTGAFESSLLALDPKTVGAPVVRMRDFSKALSRVRPSVSQEDLVSYEKFTSEFGEES